MFGSALVRSTWALPSPNVSRVRIKAKPGINHGIAGVDVTSVSTNTIVSSDMAGATINAGTTWVGRRLSVIGRQTGSTPYASYTITAFNPATGALTVAPDPNGTVLAGDAIVIRSMADGPNSGGYTSITDSGYLNSTMNGGQCLTPGALAGSLIRVVHGTGRGTPPRKITGNTNKSITWVLPMPMNVTTVWITEGATWQYQADTAAIENGSPLTAATLTIPASNYTQRPMVIAGSRWM